MALKHHEEIIKLMEKQKEYVAKIVTELHSVSEPLVTASNTQEIDRTGSILYVLEDDDDKPVESC